MPPATDHREAIVAALAAFGTQPLPDAARSLFTALGYQSDRRVPIATPQDFMGQLDASGKLTPGEREALSQASGLHLLFQLTDAELNLQADLFDDAAALEATKIESYLFFAVDLPDATYTRTALATLVRAINKPLPMPALVLFLHGDRVSLGMIHRRLHRRDQAKDVLEKVTLVKDITFSDPIRAHVEILNDFVLANLGDAFGVSNFVRLHEAWQKRLATYALSNDFYREIADWYFWAHHQVEDGTIGLPRHCDTEQEKSLFLIRLLTRVVFCWFLVEKRLIPSDLFRERCLKALLKDYTPSRDTKKPDAASTYYHAILQNLFFGTLNMPSEQRGFRERKKEGQKYDKNFGVTNLWRYEADFRDPADWLALAARVPFLNGGLFDCLDDKVGGAARPSKRVQAALAPDNSILDGFSDNPTLGCHLPNDLFFGPERTVDLSKDYGEEDKRTARTKKAKVRGLIEILSRYKFTIEENTPLEEEIALDPELLGKVFENLLASYNEDTRTTARKALGAFYTPREIVTYMVDEALKSYLGTQVPRCKGALDDLFSNKATLKEIKADTRDALIAAIGRVKILDPACGSGAFPMGALHRLVDLLQKLDPNNESWKRDRLAEARRYRELLENSGATPDELAACDARIADIEKSFDSRFHALDFARKLYLVENCIYGVDIQPIATQIAKLRFFISLVVDQKVCPEVPNLGVRPLPNLETRLVAADTLIPLTQQLSQADLFTNDSVAYKKLQQLKAELKRIRHEHFNARDPRKKRHWRDEDRRVREAMRELLGKTGTPARDADAMSAWDPYDQNTFAPFFDSEWMFGLLAGKGGRGGPPLHSHDSPLLGNLAIVNDASGQTELAPAASRATDSGFDIVIGNPPYVRMEEIKQYKDAFRIHYACFTGRADLYVFFYEAALHLLRTGGVISFITSNKYFRAAYGAPLRKLLVTTTRIQQLVDFGDASVFTAVAYPSILIAQKLPEGVQPDSSASVRALLWEPGPAVERFAEVVASKSIGLPQRSLVGDAWRITGSTVSLLIERLRSTGSTLRELSSDRIFYGVKTGFNDAFVIDSVTRRRLIAEDEHAAEIIKPFLRGRDVKRWAANTNAQWLIYTRKGIDISRYPSVAAYMLPFKRALEERATKQEWYELQQPQYAYSSAFEGPKIIYPDIYEHQSFAIDLTGSYLANTCYFLPLEDKWLCAILNSSVVEWFYSHISNSVRGGYLRAFTDYVRQIPIPNANTIERQTLDRLVDPLAFLTRHCADHAASLASRDPLMLAYWERILNGMVYELYFPDELHAAGLRFFDLVEQAHILGTASLPESELLATLRQKFDELYDVAHPLRIALDKLQTLDTVRIIEPLGRSSIS